MSIGREPELPLPIAGMCLQRSGVQVRLLMFARIPRGSLRRLRIRGGAASPESSTGRSAAVTYQEARELCTLTAVFLHYFDDSPATNPFDKGTD